MRVLASRSFRVCSARRFCARASAAASWDWIFERRDRRDGFEGWWYSRVSLGLRAAGSLPRKRRARVRR